MRLKLAIYSDLTKYDYIDFEPVTYPNIGFNQMQKQDIRPYGARIREERARLGLTQAAFALQAGVSKTSQVSYEAGLHTPDLTYLEAVSQMGVDPLFVVSGKRMDARQADDVFNWQMAEDLLGLVDEYARIRAYEGHDVDAPEKMRLIRYFYRLFSAGGKIDGPTVADTFELTSATKG